MNVMCPYTKHIVRAHKRRNLKVQFKKWLKKIKNHIEKFIDELLEAMAKYPPSYHQY